MKLTIDTTNKTIELHEDILVINAIDELESFLKDKEDNWRQYTLVANPVTKQWAYPYIINNPSPYTPKDPWHNPSWEVYCYDNKLDTSNGRGVCKCKKSYD